MLKSASDASHAGPSAATTTHSVAADVLNEFGSQLPDKDPQETAEWLESIESVVNVDGSERARFLLHKVLRRAREMKVGLPTLVQTPYINTIPPEREPEYPGDLAMEKRVRRIIRWNAAAMVTRANKHFDGLGGHISTYASSASLYEVGFNHFFRGRNAEGGGDQVFIQGHATPGIYARAFLEGRLSEENLDHFRRETAGKGLSSYPHPWLMPDFWEFPTVSMGLSPIAAIYQARFNRYLHSRGLKDTANNRVWAFLGDGECDEPETLGALPLAARERLDNLVFVVNCNLQRLDGPVRGNGKIIQELEAAFRGAGWHVIKVIWGEDWDPLLANDHEGLLVDRMNEVVDGQFQKYAVESGDYIRRDFFGSDERLLNLVSHLTDEQLRGLRRGGHSHSKLYAAYRAAVEHTGQPVVILAKTVKGWTLGKSFEGSNVTHQMKKLDEEQLRKFRETLHLDISDAELAKAPYYHPGPNSDEVRYMLERRRELGGSLPKRPEHAIQVSLPADDLYKEFYEGTKGNVQVSTTMAFVRILRKLLRDKTFGPHIVPIIPDEARTFGMESLFREIGIYAPFGQNYDPVDSKTLLYYKESSAGQLLEEGITEAGSMASFSAAATSYSTHGITTVPFYMFYSMFGLQRTGDQAWALGDMRGRGFLMGGTAGRTTLNGEGLQHQDGHSLFVANVLPTCHAYDPAFAYELAVIIKDGLRRMIDEDEDVFYYLTIYNENLDMPPMPKRKNIEDGILRGLYKYNNAPQGKQHGAQLFGSGPLLQHALRAQKILADDYDVGAQVWSATSYSELYRDARAAERYNRLHPTKKQRVPYITQALKNQNGPVVTSSDWIAELPSLLGRFIPNRLVPLGTNGFGRSDTREALRRHFEIDAEHIVVATLWGLFQDGKIGGKVVEQALERFEIDPERLDSMLA